MDDTRAGLWPIATNRYSAIEPEEEKRKRWRLVGSCELDMGWLFRGVAAVVLARACVWASLHPTDAARAAAAMAAAAVLLLVYAYWPARRVWHLPGGAWPRPFLGQLPEMRRMGYHALQQASARVHGPVSVVYQGRRPTVVIADPELAHEILVLEFAQVGQTCVSFVPCYAVFPSPDVAELQRLGLCIRCW